MGVLVLFSVADVPEDAKPVEWSGDSGAVQAEFKQNSQAPNIPHLYVLKELPGLSEGDAGRMEKADAN